MNKKLFALGMVVILTATSFIGCKKGENDPGLSLRSRKARITGTWELTSALWTESYKRGSTFDEIIHNFNGKEMVATNEGEKTTYQLSESITINKDGSFESKTVEKYELLTTTTESKGYWYFLKKVNNLDIKNKERVEFLITSAIKTNVYGTNSTNVNTRTEIQYSGKENSNSFTLLLNKLSHKEIIVALDRVTDNIQDGSKTSTKGKKTYTLKK